MGEFSCDFSRKHGHPNRPACSVASVSPLPLITRRATLDSIFPAGRRLGGRDDSLNDPSGFVADGSWMSSKLLGLEHDRPRMDQRQIRKDFAYRRALTKAIETAQTPEERTWFEADRRLREKMTLHDIGIWSRYVGDASQLSLLKSPTGHGIGLPTKRVADAS